MEHSHEHQHGVDDPHHDHAHELPLAPAPAIVMHMVTGIWCTAILISRMRIIGTSTDGRRGISIGG